MLHHCNKNVFSLKYNILHLQKYQSFVSIMKIITILLIGIKNTYWIHRLISLLQFIIIIINIIFMDGELKTLTEYLKACAYTHLLTCAFFIHM